MKTAVIKKSTVAFITFVLALAFALVGCGGFTANPEEPFLGSWKISGGELEGEDFDEETLDAMEDWGINCILIFEEDGEGQIDLYNHVSDITWKIEDDGTAKIKADGASFKATLKDGELTLKESKNRIVFTKSKKDLSGTVKKDREATEKSTDAMDGSTGGTTSGASDRKDINEPITPAVTVADDDVCTITVTEKFEDRWGIIGLKVEITNKTDKDLTFHSVSGKTSVNNTMKTGWFSCRMMGGTNATEKFTFSTGDLNSIDELVNINFTIGVYEDDTYEDFASYSATIA